MNITDEIASSEQSRARVAVAPEHNGASPAALDPEPSAAEQARLAHGPLVISPTLHPASPIAAAAMMDTQPRRFDWPRLQPKSNAWPWLGLIYPLGWCVFSVWNEFVGTWVLSWGLALPLIGLLLIIELWLLQVGERLPRFGRSWAEVSAAGVRLRLFYGRKPAMRGKSFSINSPIWPVRRFISWPEVAKVALYTASYRGLPTEPPQRTMYWVKLWTQNNTGYVALITDMEAQANELVNMLAQHASLGRWAIFDASQTSLLDPSLGLLDADTLTLWRADRRRISGKAGVDSITAMMWHAPQRQLICRPGFQLRPRTLIKLAALLILLALFFNYDYLLSFLLWQPPATVTTDATWLGAHHDAGNSNASSQTLIPPLHEVWHSPPKSEGRPILSLAAGKLLAIDNSTVNVYDAASGKLLSNIGLNSLLNLNAYERGVALATLSADGNYVYFTLQNGVDYAPQYSFSSGNSLLNALDLRSGKLVWSNITGGNVQFAYAPERNLLISSSLVLTASESITTSDYLIEALDPHTSKQLWHSSDLGLFAPKQIVIGGDTVYALMGNGGNKLVALDIASGTTRWQIDLSPDTDNRTQYDYRLQADTQHVYVVDIYYLHIYTSDGREVGPTQGGVRTGGNEVLVNGLVISNDYDTLLATSATEQTTLGYINLGYSFFGNSDVNMVASNGLLFATVNRDGNFFGDTRLLVFDLSNGRSVWRSPSFSNGDSNAPIIIGNGMLYTVYDGEVHAFAGAR